MVPKTRKEWIRLFVGASLLGILVAAGLWLWISGYLQEVCRQLMRLLEDREHLRDYLRSWGIWAPLVFAGLQGLQVVFAPIPGEVTGIAGGFVFGTWRAALYSTIGLSLGSVLAFLAARVIGQPVVKLFVNEKTVEKFHFLTERRGTIATLILFMIPGFPKDILSYLLGLSPMHFLTFVVVCSLGRIPGTVMLCLSGSALYKENWHLLMFISGAVLVLVVIFWFKGDAIREWLKEKTHHESGGSS